MGEADNGNGRISTADRLARIETKLDQVLLLIPKVGDLERTQAAQDEKIKNICEDVDGLEGKVNAWSWGNSLAAVAAAILAGLGLSK